MGNLYCCTMMKWSSLLLPLLTLLSFTSTTTADATEDARMEVVRGMGKGLQNSIELRRMLIAKQEPMEAMEQYRHIVRIRTEEFGIQSAEAAAALTEGSEFAQKHGLDPALAVYTPPVDASLGSSTASATSKEEV